MLFRSVSLSVSPSPCPAPPPTTLADYSLLPCHFLSLFSLFFPGSFDTQFTNKTTCKATLDKWMSCPVKADPGCDWACAYGWHLLQDLFDCNSKTTECQESKCTHREPCTVVSCKSVSDMWTAVCNLTPDEIQTMVADYLQEGFCAVDGVTFGPSPVRPVQTTPAPVRPVQTTPAPAVIAVPVESPKAPADTKHFVMLTITLPYTKADFDQAKQEKYKAAMAATAGTSVANVVIEMITEKRRSAGSVDVKTKVT